MVTLIRNHLFDTLHVDLGRILGSLLCFAISLTPPPPSQPHSTSGPARRRMSPRSAACRVTATTAPVSRSTACSALCAKCVRPSLHLRNPRIPVRRALPLLIRHPLLTLAVQPACQVFPARRLYARSLRRRPTQKLLIAFPVSRRTIESASPRSPPTSLHRSRSASPSPPPTIGQHPQHSSRTLRCMRFHVDQTAGLRAKSSCDPAMSTSSNPIPHSARNPRQRIRQLPGNPAFTVDALKVAQQQRPEVDPRGQRRPLILSRA